MLNWFAIGFTVAQALAVFKKKDLQDDFVLHCAKPHSVSFSSHNKRKSHAWFH